MLHNDTKETFAKIRQVGMWLNLKKMFIGVPAKKCLGFIVSERGIEADPEKIRATQEMALP